MFRCGRSRPSTHLRATPARRCTSLHVHESYTRTHWLLFIHGEHGSLLGMESFSSLSRHPDFATAVVAHPTDDKLFLTGCIDGKVRLVHWKGTVHIATVSSSPHYAHIVEVACMILLKKFVRCLRCRQYGVKTGLLLSDCTLTCPCPVHQARLWSIPEQKVLDDVVVHEMVTAVALSSDGGRAVVATLMGKCRFYQISNGKLEYSTQVGECCVTNWIVILRARLRGK